MPQSWKAIMDESEMADNCTASFDVTQVNLGMWDHLLNVLNDMH